MTNEAAASTTHQFQAEVSRVLSLVINSLYSNKEIFLRELISNAADALDKLRFAALTDKALLDEATTLRIRLIPDEKAGTLTIWDNGIGMSRQDLQTNLGTIAYSGSQEFLKKLEEVKEQKNLELIGQFGVGFYSSYLVADRVDVISRAAGEADAHRWSSDGRDGFTIEAAEREVHGCSVVLHVKEEQRGFIEEWRLRTLVTRYADYVDHPIEVLATPDRDDEPDAGPKFEQINEASALWQKPSSELSDEQYNEFYKHLSHDWEPSRAHIHFKVEGTQDFTGILFIPTRAPFDLHQPEGQRGVRLYVKRVFIMEDCKELVPRWLRFVRGMVDSNDLPLNISRELLQDSSLVRVIRQQLVKKTLSMLETLAEEKSAEYLEFWKSFGAVFKEGLHAEPKQRERLAKLVRFETRKSEEPLSLAQYVAQMPEGQPAIYYAMGPTRRMLDTTPSLEALKKKDYDVLYMLDGIDQWAVDGLSEFAGVPVKSAMTADFKLDASESAEADQKIQAVALESLTERIKSVLTDQIDKVAVSERLTDSPVCLVLPEGGMPSHIERMLRYHNQDLPAQKRIMEINPAHELIKHLDTLNQREPDNTQVVEWIEMLFDQALLQEGSPITDPARFASRMTRLMQSAAFAEVLRP